MRIGIDAMGGDRAPTEQVKGALAAREFLGEAVRIVLIGDRTAICRELRRAGGSESDVEIQHAEEVIGMNDMPVEALRAKHNSSIGVMAQMQADGEIDACISAGNTGACVAASQMRLHRLRGVRRPGIAIVTPTYHGPVAVCDVGANINCRPQHVYQYGIMASVYLSAVCGVTNPRVGLLSIGEESAKGNELVKRARELLESDQRVNFIGNVEGRDLFRGVCDVVACDGFVGNVVLKLMEGMAEAVVKTFINEMAISIPHQGDAIQQAARSIVLKYDFNEYGGAPLLGIEGICIICHGASNYRGIMNAVRVARDFSKHRVNEQITELLSQSQRTING